jgi:glycosyltransferase involved in cell wall biosynthesis
MAILIPLLYFKAIKSLKHAYRSDSENIIYNCGPPDILNLGILYHAKLLHYKIVFDIVEDYDSAMIISRSITHRIVIAGIQFLTHHISSLASGIVVVSSHLSKKYKDLTKSTIPIHYLPISVDFDRYPRCQATLNVPTSLFYSGSFGMKDGVLILLDAFDILAAKHTTIQLILTGKGSEEEMSPVFDRINTSPHKERIDYRGYLDDNAYYATLNSVDFPCMTRIDIPYAQAGFPFKLGEFLATGKPVIASSVSDVACLLRDRYDVMLVRPGDSAEIVAAVEYLIAKPNEAIAIGTRGREAAKKYFDYRSQGEALLVFIRGI